jgi:hypothetical protein
MYGIAAHRAQVKGVFSPNYPNNAEIGIEQHE